MLCLNIRHKLFADFLLGFYHDSIGFAISILACVEVEYSQKSR